MEKLEISLKESSVKKPVTEDKRQYRGLQLIEDRIYMGGTSIKYWM